MHEIQQEPRCGCNRALKLTVTHTVRLRFCYFSIFMRTPVQLAKRDIVTTVICYITIDFHYTKCDSRLPAHGGVMLQRVFIEKNVNRHFSLNLSKFSNRNNCPQCLVVFSIVILCFSTIRISLHET